MGIRNSEELRKMGFKECARVKELVGEGIYKIPEKPGVYVVLRKAKENPEFLPKSHAGHFNGKNPSITKISILTDKWVKGTQLIYIGQAGGNGSKVTLRHRIKLLIKFGQGKRVSHSGGRLIWQVAGHESFLICWKPTLRKDPLKLEKEMLINFKNNFGKLPFANWRIG